MDGQLSFAPLDYAGRSTKRDVFLAEIAAPVLIQTRQPLAPGLARKVAAAVRSLARALFPKPDFSPVLMARRLLPTDQIVANRF